MQLNELVNALSNTAAVSFADAVKQIPAKSAEPVLRQIAAVLKVDWADVVKCDVNAAPGAVGPAKFVRYAALCLRAPVPAGGHLWAAASHAARMLGADGADGGAKVRREIVRALEGKPEKAKAPAAPAQVEKPKAGK